MLFIMKEFSHVSTHDWDFRVYGFQEFAMIIYPQSSPRQASRNLRNFINRNAELKQKIEDKGYTDRKRTLMPSHIELIVSYM